MTVEQSKSTLDLHLWCVYHLPYTLSLINRGKNNLQVRNNSQMSMATDSLVSTPAVDTERNMIQQRRVTYHKCTQSTCSPQEEIIEENKNCLYYIKL